MTPTPYAIAVREQVRMLMQQVQSVLAPSREPDLTTLSAAEDLGLTLLPLPLELPSAPVYLSWHQRYDTDPAHVWLRDLARTALTSAAKGRSEAMR